MSRQASLIVADFGRYKDLFDFTKDELSYEVAAVIAEGIYDYMAAELDPDGNPWPPLSEKYAEWKAKHFPGQDISDLHHHMRDPTQLVGSVGVWPHRMVMTYGKDEQAQDEAVWFSEGNERQPARPFYEFNELVLSRLRELFDRHFETVIGN